MSQKRIETIVDFEKEIEMKFEMCEEGYVWVKEENEMTYYRKANEYRGQQVYERCDPVENDNWKKIIGKIKPSGTLIVYSVINIEMEES